MSSNYSALMTMTFVVAIALAANRAEESAPTTPPGRDPAALKKELVLGTVEAPLHRHTEKLQGPVEAAVDLIGERPEKSGDVFVMRATISSSVALENVDYKWSLPADVQVVNGELKGQIAVLAPGKPAEVTLTLKSLSGANHQVHLIASAAKGGTRFAQSTQYNTLLEPVLDAGRKNLHKSSKADAEATGKLKVFH
ncbi:MAG: hypothetical protein KF799_03425 [Bdellovibrionales bacterium]|nr:hypothetical protein [Bdellovibrionales bacterium]